MALCLADEWKLGGCAGATARKGHRVKPFSGRRVEDTDPVAGQGKARHGAYGPFMQAIQVEGAHHDVLAPFHGNVHIQVQIHVIALEHVVDDRAAQD
jgi:hypothetical protein